MVRRAVLQCRYTMVCSSALLVAVPVRLKWLENKKILLVDMMEEEEEEEKEEKGLYYVIMDGLYYY